MLQTQSVTSNVLTTSFDVREDISICIILLSLSLKQLNKTTLILIQNVHVKSISNEDLEIISELKEAKSKKINILIKAHSLNVVFTYMVCSTRCSVAKSLLDISMIYPGSSPRQKAVEVIEMLIWLLYTKET